MEKNIDFYDSDKDDPDFTCYSSDSGDEMPDSSQQNSSMIEPIKYSHFSYQDFSIPKQILPLTGDDSDFCYDAERYTEISSIGFDAMKEACDFLNSLIDQNDELQVNQERVNVRSGPKSKNAQKPLKKNIIFPYAFYKKSKRKQPPKTKISAELQGFVGKANILAAQGNHKDAVDLCLKLIESSPNAWEPLHTLAFVYKESGDQTKYLEYLLSCAQIKKHDCQLWGQLGSEFFQLGRSEWAKACYERAVRCNVLYIPLVWEWVCINYKSGYILAAGNILFRFLRLYLKTKQESKLLANLQCLLPRLYPHVNIHVFETYMRLYINNKNYLMIYNEVIQCFHIPLSLASVDDNNKIDIDLCGLLKQAETDETLQQLTNLLYILPSNILVLFAFLMSIIMKSPTSDYTFKLVNILYRRDYTCCCLDYFNYISDNVTTMAVSSDPNISFENDHFYGWLNVGECYWKKNTDENTLIAITIYTEFLERFQGMLESKAPQYFYLYLIAAFGYWRMSKMQKAYDQIEYYLTQEISSKNNSYIVNFVSYLIDEIYGPHEYRIISENMINEELIRNALILLWINRYDANKIKEHLPIFLQSLEKMLWCVDNTDLITTPIKRKFLTLFHRHMNQILDRLKLPILYSFQEELCWRFISFCIHNDWHSLALSTLFKHLTTCSETAHLLENNFLWNIFSLLLHKIKLNASTRRMLSVALGYFTQLKESLSERALLASAHNRLLNFKNYRALEKYYLLCFYHPREPNYFLYMAISLANVAFRKHIDNYGSVALQSACVMQHYFKLQGGYASQQACYNLGRCYHQLKMFDLAIPLYENALALNSSEDCLYSIIAYNLAHIYTQSGNYVMAKQLLRSYCTI